MGKIGIVADYKSTAINYAKENGINREDVVALIDVESVRAFEGEIIVTKTPFKGFIEELLTGKKLDKEKKETPVKKNPPVKNKKEETTKPKENED